MEFPTGDVRGGVPEFRNAEFLARMRAARDAVTQRFPDRQPPEAVGLRSIQVALRTGKSPQYVKHHAHLEGVGGELLLDSQRPLLVVLGSCQISLIICDIAQVDQARGHVRRTGG